MTTTDTLRAEIDSLEKYVLCESANIASATNARNTLLTKLDAARARLAEAEKAKPRESFEVRTINGDSLWYRGSDRADAERYIKRCEPQSQSFYIIHLREVVPVRVTREIARTAWQAWWDASGCGSEPRAVAAMLTAFGIPATPASTTED